MRNTHRPVVIAVSTAVGVVAMMLIASLLSKPWAIDRKSDLLCARLWRECAELGLCIPYDIDNYYSSVMGSPCRVLKTGVRAVGEPFYNPTVLRGFRLTWATNKGFVTCKVENDVFCRRLLIWPCHWVSVRERRYPRLALGYRTGSLLSSATAGVGLWRSKTKVFLLGTEPDAIPSIGFARPATQKELDEYWRWLEKMTGSLDRFRDDWGHMIRLSIENKAAAPLLAASSSGPDGKWNTRDDMVLRRDIKTGRIVERIGFGK